MNSYWIVGAVCGSAGFSRPVVTRGTKEYGPFVSFRDLQTERARLASQTIDDGKTRYRIKERKEIAQ